MLPLILELLRKSNIPYQGYLFYGNPEGVRKLSEIMKFEAWIN